MPRSFHLKKLWFWIFFSLFIPGHIFNVMSIKYVVESSLVSYSSSILFFNFGTFLCVSICVNDVNMIIRCAVDEVFSNLAHTLVVILPWVDQHLSSWIKVTASVKVMILVCLFAYSGAVCFQLKIQLYFVHFFARFICLGVLCAEKHKWNGITFLWCVIWYLVKVKFFSCRLQFLLWIYVYIYIWPCNKLPSTHSCMHFSIVGNTFLSCFSLRSWCMV